MLATGVVPSVLYVQDTPEDLALIEDLDLRCPVRSVSPVVFGGLTDVPHPQGLVAVVPMSAVTSEPRFDVWPNHLILVADGVRDPGNLGTLLRSAAGTGATEVLVTPNSVDPFNPKCVRSAMGAHFLISLRQVTWDPLVEYLARVSVIVVADANGTDAYDAVPWTESCAIVIGSEAHGPNDRVAGLATAYVRIPLARNLESLNAGVAGSHLVLEAARQRRLAASVQEAV